MSATGQPISWPVSCISPAAGPRWRDIDAITTTYLLVGAMNDLSPLRRSQEPPSNRSCGLRAALDVVAGKWKPLILWHLLPGPQRYGALRRQVGTISEKVFVEQLRQLEADQIVARAVLSEQPLAVEYALTTRGQTLVPVLARISQWGFEHVIEATSDQSSSS